MRQLIAALIALILGTLPGLGMAQGHGPRLLAPRFNVDKPTLRRGARFFALHCQGCHTLKYLRYSRAAADLGMNEQQVKAQLMIPDSAEFFSTMVNTMNPDEAARWLGAVPPDLTLEGRFRGSAWIYSFLQGFYLDPSTQSGWNNRYFPSVAMPNVLAPLGGVRNAQGKVLRPGSMTPEQFDRALNDVTAWLTYTSDPSRLIRHALAVWVMPFLGVFAALGYLLMRTYWRNVH